MTEWIKATAYMDNRPLEIDKTSSPTTVYERKDINEVTFKNNDGTEIKMWEYLERQYTQEEYAIMKAVTENVQIRHESDIIDEYTAELIREGAI